MRAKLVGALAGLVLVGAVVVTIANTGDDDPAPTAAPSPSHSPRPTPTALPAAFCPATAASNEVQPRSKLDGKTGPRTESGPHRLAYFDVDKHMLDNTSYVGGFLPEGTSQNGPVQVVVCQYAAPNNKPIGKCGGYKSGNHAAVSVVVTGVQYTFKAYDADSKRLFDTFSLAGIRTCPTSVETINDVPQSIDAEPDYPAVIKRLLPHLRMAP